MLYNKYNHNQNIILESHANIFQIQNYKFVSACAHVREKKKTDRQTDRKKKKKKFRKKKGDGKTGIKKERKKEKRKKE